MNVKDRILMQLDFLKVKTNKTFLDITTEYVDYLVKNNLNTLHFMFLILFTLDDLVRFTSVVWAEHLDSEQRSAAKTMVKTVIIPMIKSNLKRLEDLVE